MKPRRVFFLFIALLVFLTAFRIDSLYRSIGTFSGVVRGLLGRSLVLSESDINVGRVSPGEAFTRCVRLHNNSKKPIRLLGNSATCSCLSIMHGDELNSGESSYINLTITPPTREDSFVYIVNLFTDMPGYERIYISIAGYVDSEP